MSLTRVRFTIRRMMVAALAARGATSPPSGIPSGGGAGHGSPPMTGGPGSGTARRSGRRPGPIGGGPAAPAGLVPYRLGATSVPVTPLDGSPAGGPGIRWSKASIFPQSRQKGAEADLLPIPTAWTHRLGARGDRVDRNVPGGPPRPQGSCDLLSGAAVRPLRSDHPAGYFDSLTEGRAERKFARDQARPGHAISAVSPPRPATLRRWREVRRWVPGGHAERTRDGTQRATGTASRGHAWREPGGRLA
jgi:hypothetical protein